MEQIRVKIDELVTYLERENGDFNLDFKCV